MSTTPRVRRIRLYPSFHGWWIVAVSFFALFTHGAATSYLFGLLVVPMENDLGWSRTTLVGALTVATFVTSALGMVMGPVFDRHGARIGMVSSALLGGSCLVLLAMVQTPWQFYFLLGVGVGAARTGLENIGPRTAIANWFIRRRAAAFAWSSGGRAVFGFTMVPAVRHPHRADLVAGGLGRPWHRRAHRPHPTGVVHHPAQARGSRAAA